MEGVPVKISSVSPPLPLTTTDDRRLALTLDQLKRLSDSDLPKSLQAPLGLPQPPAFHYEIATSHLYYHRPPAQSVLNHSHRRNDDDGRLKHPCFCSNDRQTKPHNPTLVRSLCSADGASKLTPALAPSPELRTTKWIGKTSGAGGHHCPTSARDAQADGRARA